MRGGEKMAEGLPAELIEPHYSNRLLPPLLAALEDELGGPLVDRILADAGLPRSYLLDTEGWVSHAFVSRFVAAVARHGFGLEAPPPHDHPMWTIWRVAGRRGFEPGSIGPAYSLLRGFAAPSALYRGIPGIAQRANRLVQFEVVRASPGQVVFAARPLRSREHWTAGHCWHAIGLLEAVPVVWRLPRARVDHPVCLPRGGGADRCLYRVTFIDRPLATSLYLAFVMGAAGTGAALLAALLGSLDVAPMAGLAGAALAAGAEGWRRYVQLARTVHGDAERFRHGIETADVRYARLWEERQRLRHALLAARKLSGYLPQDLAERILDDPDIELGPGGRRVDAAVLFVDIVDFTSRCERFPPERVVDELNRYFSRIDPVFQRHGGVVDKRIGDGVMVVFVCRGGEAIEAAATRAVEAAAEALSAVERLNRELRAAGAEPFAVRAGIAVGPVVQGNMGSRERLEYTVIGDTVNLAARLEGASAPGRVLVQAGPWVERARGAAVEGRRSIRVKGRRAPVDVVLARPAGPP